MSGYGLGQPTYTDMKGWMVIDPLLSSYSGLTGKSQADAKRSLQQLIAHIAAKKLEDDIVCKLSVPMMGGVGGTYEIDITVTDVMVMLAVGANHTELTRRVTDMRERVRLNDLNQQMFTTTLLELQSQITQMVTPREIAQPIVAELTKSGLMP